MIKVVINIIFEQLCVEAIFVNEYTKVIGVMGNYFTREHEKIKHHKNKVRFLSEATVAKNFLEGNAIVHVFFEETGKEIEIGPESSREDIQKYLGRKFYK